MAKAADGSRTFLVQILDTQNSTWQGTVTRTDSQQVLPFRSALELLKIIDSTLENQQENDN